MLRLRSVCSMTILGLISLYAENDGALRYIKQSLTNYLANHDMTCNRVIWPILATASQRDNVVNIVHGDHGSVTAPTPLVYVGSEDSKDPPRLVDGQEYLYNGGYLILSYCWGLTPKDAPWLLTTATLQQFTSDIRLTVLPQTLHDAIIWTRKLGERYIWMDSMCILQDSEEDWQCEASAMASIYGCATLTLVAAFSSVYGGMSDRRNPLRNSSAGLSLQDGSSTSTTYLLSKRTTSKRGTTTAHRQPRLVLPGRLTLEQVSEDDAEVCVVAMRRRRE